VLPDRPGSISDKIKRSKASWRRAAVLIGVHVIILIHVLQWLYSGMTDGVRSTVSPVEPSESMYTLEQGLVNAGFVFFVLAVASTLVFGRFFCGWGCHVVALQDLCSWVMEKIGVRPRPFRSRLLMLAPLGLALYMFVWPTARREIFVPAAAAVGVEWPVWLGEATPFPGFQAGFIVEDFWATFPPWYVAIPFLLVCGFVVVYFLGSKGFCTYGCPYGGFFAPADLVAPGKIVVNERCNGCGHCTAICTSNVRVHEEVRDFGKVVDPGCMKCLDCVSVCPNEALSWGWSTPTVASRPLTPGAAARVAAKKKNPKRYDLSRREEVVFALVFLGLLVAFRGMFGLVPLLMAVGLAGIGTFLSFKLWRAVTTLNVRIHGLLIRVKGRWTWGGRAFAVVTVGMLVLAGWSGAVRYHLWQAGLLDAGVRADPARVFAAGYTPDPAAAARVDRAIALFTRGSSPAEGGFGWRRDAGTNLRLSWLHAVAGRYAHSEAALRRAMDQSQPAPGLLQDMGRLMFLQGKTPAQAADALREVLRRWPGLDAARLDIARIELSQGRQRPAMEQIDTVLAPRVVRASTLRDAADLLIRAGQPARAFDVMQRAARIDAGDVSTQASLAVAAAVAGRAKEARDAIDRVNAIDRANPAALNMVATAWLIMEQPDPAEQALRRAIEADPKNPEHPARLAQIFDALGRTAEAAQMRGVAARLAAERASGAARESR
jgi:tetratricopeptide (TPR) repeat protein/Fe-S-cluster-containing hydrogenase component 2